MNDNTSDIATKALQLAHTGTAAFSPERHHQVAAAGALRQLFGALLAENLLQREMPEGQAASTSVHRYRLQSAAVVLETSGARDTLGVYRRFERLAAVFPGGRSRVLSHPEELLSLLVGEGAVEPAVAERIASEMRESIRNDAACHRFRTQRDQRIAASLRRHGSSFWSWLRAGNAGSNPALFLEQWSAVGHPYHIMKKSKQGLPLEEVIANAPEFTANVPVTLLAVRRSRLHVETAEGKPTFADYMTKKFPAWVGRWSAALRAANLCVDDFLPLPAHPLQVQYLTPRLGTDGDVFVPKHVTLKARPTSSFRTLVPGASAILPHLKLAVDIRLTTVARTISPRSCEMGPRISTLLRDIMEREPDIASRLSLAPEIYGLHFVDGGGADAPLESNIAAIVRENPMQQVGDGEFLVPATAFSLPVPGAEQPFLVDVLETHGDASLAAAQRFFRRYSTVLLTGTLGLYLGYGIALEAHQQNIFAVMDGNGRVIRFVARDFGGIRIHRPSLEARGYALRLHPDRLTVLEQWRGVQRKLLTPAYQYHLGEIAATLAIWYGCADDLFWKAIAEATEEVLALFRDDTEAARWHAERDAIMRKDWDLKATLRMRLADQSRDLYTHFPNPLVPSRHGA